MAKVDKQGSTEGKFLEWVSLALLRLFNQEVYSLTAAGIPVSSGHTPIIRCWRSLCQWFGSNSKGGLERFRQENKGFGRQLCFRNESLLRSWSPLNNPPTLVPCKHKVLLPLGRKSTTRPECLFEAYVNSLGFPSHLQSIVPAGVCDRSNFLIQRKPKTGITFLAKKIISIAFRQVQYSEINHRKHYLLVWFHERFFFKAALNKCFM